MNPLETIKEYCKVESIFRRTGGFNLVTTNLSPGAILPPLTPLSLNFATRKATVVKNVKVYENALINATAIKVAKGSLAFVGMYLGNGEKAAQVTAINTTNAAYDLLTITLGAAVTAGQVLFETIAQVGAVNEVKGVHTLTVSANATAGDKIKFNDIEIEFAAAPAEGKAVVGATTAATVQNLDDVLDEYTELTDLYEISYKGAKIIFKEKVGGTGTPVLVVTPVESTGTLAAAIEETTEGVAGVAATSVVPLNVCNGLLYDWSIKVGDGESLTAIGAVMEIKESKLIAPVSAQDKASLGARFDFI